CAREEGTGYW
nr:immunoglobulin heavy chain junction region [Mus musculus]MBK4184277.1 immunoglobulin heavy chain junction region [Mus musculus]